MQSYAEPWKVVGVLTSFGLRQEDPVRFRNLTNRAGGHDWASQTSRVRS